MCRPHVRVVPFSKLFEGNETRGRHTSFEPRSLRLIRLPARMKKQLAVLALGALAIGCRDSHASASKVETKETPRQTKITIVYGSEKKTWLEAELATFAKTNPDVLVDAKAMGSGEAVTAIKSGSLKAHVFSPASSAYLELLDGKPLD